MRPIVVLCAVALLTAAGALAPAAGGEQASEPASPSAAALDVGASHTCALLAGGSVRCWGYGAEGELGYGSTSTVGDDETPGFAGPVNLGTGRTATAIALGDYHTCALLDNGSVRCWGFGADGRLGYANASNVGDDETPGSVGPVDLGAGRTAVSITAGSAHTCAVLDDGSVRCWGFGDDRRLGRSSAETIGDDESPGSIAPVNLDRPALAVSAGIDHTCALLDNGNVRCWGLNRNGQLGYGTTATAIGDPLIIPASPGAVRDPVNLGVGRTAVAIGAGGAETCAVLDDATVRCWGYGGFGRLGYANTDTIGDDETPGSMPPIDLGAGAKAISVGDGAVCARLDGGALRCWGLGGYGQLGYGNRDDIGDDESPATVGPVNLGTGRTALAVSVGRSHTCVRLDDATVRCWGQGADGRLGVCGSDSVGDDEAPTAIGPVKLAAPADGGNGCSPPTITSPAPPPPPPPPPLVEVPPPPPAPVTATTTGAQPPAPQSDASDLAAQAVRLRGLRTCRASVARQARLDTRRARRLSGARRRRAERLARRHRIRLHGRCLRRYGRTPGPVTHPFGFGTSTTTVLLQFGAAGTDGTRGPAAQGYLVKQSRHRIDGPRDFENADTLCAGNCRFPCVTRVGAKLKLTVTDLLRRTTYYYAIRARDNVSGLLGPRSRSIKATTLAIDPPPPPPPPEPPCVKQQQ